MRLFQPFAPEELPGRRRSRQPQAPVPLRAVLPSLVTMLALCAGLTSIRMSIDDRLQLAAAFIIVAAALDGIDGRVARILKSSSRFGAELDSLSDFVNFGVAPVVLLYVWSLDELRSFGWIPVLVFGICVALRLARFNAALGAVRPDWHARFFVGVPAPAGALLVLLPFYVEMIGVPHGFATATVVWAFTLVVALLVISRVPTYSGKLVGSRIRRDLVGPLFVVGVVIVAFLASFTWETMAVLSVAYLAALPFSIRSYLRLAAAAPENDGKASSSGS